MMTFASLLIGMMESATLSAMLPINLMFMFALAQLSAMSRDVAKNKKTTADTQRGLSR